MSEGREVKNTSVSLPAIERKDLHALLEKHGMLAPFMEGRLVCASCGSVLTDLNMGALLVRGGLLVPFCNSPECIEEALRGRGK